MRSMIATFALLAAAGLAWAEDKKPERRDPPRVSHNDFLALAIDDVMAVERYSSLADKRASSDKVKETARKLQEDAKAYRKQLERAAEGLKVGFLTGLKEGSQATYARLLTLSGEKFDDEYLKAVGDKLTSLSGLMTRLDTKEELVTTFVKDRTKGVKTHLDSIREMRKGSDPERKE